MNNQKRYLNRYKYCVIRRRRRRRPRKTDYRNKPLHNLYDTIVLLLQGIKRCWPFMSGHIWNRRRRRVPVGGDFNRLYRFDVRRDTKGRVAMLLCVGWPKLVTNASKSPETRRAPNEPTVCRVIKIYYDDDMIIRVFLSFQTFPTRLTVFITIEIRRSI